MRRFFLPLVAAALILGLGWALPDLHAVDRADRDIAVWRQQMETDGLRANAEIARHVPPGVAARLDVGYDPADPQALLDIYYPADAGARGQKLPTLVWIHGGAWISGSKSHVSNYLKVIASRGFTVVGVDYPLAPHRPYPAALRQINKALAFLKNDPPAAAVDATRLFLAGDSAGAQLAAQLAGIVSESSDAAAVGIVPGIGRGDLKGVLLYCGVYDIDLAFQDVSRRRFAKLMRAYFGGADYPPPPTARQFSVLRTITSSYPPLFVTVGNDDSLAGQSRRLVEAARRHKVPVDSLLFAADHKPPLGHEYQWDLDLADARLALDRSIAFMQGVLRGPQ